MIVDTGSGLLGMYLRDTNVPDNCKELYDLHSNATIDQRLLTPKSANSPVCASFTYSVPDPDSEMCMFQISYGEGSTILSGFVAQDFVGFDNSVKVFGSSESSPKFVNAELGGMLQIAAIKNSTNCESFPGLGGMDNNQESIISQLVAQKAIGSHAMSFCLSLVDNASFVVFGSAIPKNLHLYDIPMYNGTTIQSIETENAEFEQSIQPLKKKGLSGHNYLILNGIQIGDSDTIDGPISAILDTGTPGLGVTKSMLTDVYEQISVNTENNNLVRSGPGCFLVGPSESLPEVVSRVVPNITISLTNEMNVIIPGSTFTETVVLENSDWEVCCTLLESSPQQLALGTAFFLDRFVHMNSALSVAMVNEFESCPSIPPGENGWTTNTSAPERGTYTFPYSEVSTATHIDGLIIIGASLFMSSFL